VSTAHEQKSSCLLRKQSPQTVMNIFPVLHILSTQTVQNF